MYLGTELNFLKCSNSFRLNRVSKLSSQIFGFHVTQPSAASVENCGSTELTRQCQTRVKIFWYFLLHFEAAIQTIKGNL